MTSDFELLAINLGNTRAQIGRFEGEELRASHRCEIEDLAAIVQRVIDEWNTLEDPGAAIVAVASVNDPAAARLVSMLADQLSVEIYRIGEDLPVPIGTRLDPETITGIDRLLNAAAAYDRLQQACVVIDAGTAVTVDFVDGEGTFHGGAIAPGAQMQLDAMNRRTEALPELRVARPDDDAFGRSTSQAMLKGVFHGIRGMVQRLIEIYAERFGAYPPIVATGGDAPLLFEGDPLIERIVPDLTLRGIAVSVKRALAPDS